MTILVTSLKEDHNCQYYWQPNPRHVSENLHQFWNWTYLSFFLFFFSYFLFFCTNSETELIYRFSLFPFRFSLFCSNLKQIWTKKIWSKIFLHFDKYTSYLTNRIYRVTNLFYNLKKKDLVKYIFTFWQIYFIFDKYVL